MIKLLPCISLGEYINIFRLEMAPILNRKTDFLCCVNRRRDSYGLFPFSPFLPAVTATGYPQTAACWLRCLYTGHIARTCGCLCLAYMHDRSADASYPACHQSRRRSVSQLQGSGSGKRASAGAVRPEIVIIIIIISNK